MIVTSVINSKKLYYNILVINNKKSWTVLRGFFRSHYKKELFLFFLFKLNRFQRSPTMIRKALLFSNDLDHALFCGFGILVSVYALYVETRKHKDSRYRAAWWFWWKYELLSCAYFKVSQLKVLYDHFECLLDVLCSDIVALVLQSLLVSAKIYCFSPNPDSTTIA